MVCDIPYAHIAGSQFEKEHFDLYFKDLFPVDQLKDHMRNRDTMDRQDVVTLYFALKSIHEVLETADINCSLCHISTAMASFLRKTGKPVLCCIIDHTLHIACAENGRFKFYNQFKCYHKEDFLYFISLVLDDQKLDSHQTEIIIGGDIAADSPLYGLLSKYLATLILYSDNIYDAQVDSDVDHYYLSMLLAGICE